MFVVTLPLKRAKISTEAVMCGTFFPLYHILLGSENINYLKEENTFKWERNKKIYKII